MGLEHQHPIRVKKPPPRDDLMTKTFPESHSRDSCPNLQSLGEFRDAIEWWMCNSKGHRRVASGKYVFDCFSIGVFEFFLASIINWTNGLREASRVYNYSNLQNLASAAVVKRTATRFYRALNRLIWEHPIAMMILTGMSELKIVRSCQLPWCLSLLGIASQVYIIADKWSRRERQSVARVWITSSCLGLDIIWDRSATRESLLGDSFAVSLSAKSH